ncbi:MAG: ABC transporter permease [Candidatus Latescibacteria bacterium]|nr:ABC transporter permease [Candidatus Latescibacterota bacterium]
MVSRAGASGTYERLDLAIQEHEMLETEAEPQAITVRSVVIGLVLVLVLGFVGTYVRYHLHASRMAIGHVPMGMLMPFMVLLFGFAMLGKKAQFLLRPEEWHVILAMALAGAMLPVSGVTGYMIGYIAGPYFKATDENNWAEYLHPHMPTWLVPNNDNDAISWFYQGMPLGAEIPWDVWMVYERFREIGVYSVVGLAPVHISFLFIAEACVYAVLGTVSGYLMGQGVAKVLLWGGWLEGFTLNYSALSTVISSALVMVVVILSALYPARQASLMAVPDVTRRWKMPPPEGDHWTFEFPFTVSGRDVFGLSVYLVDFFKAHESEDMGNFFTEGATFDSMQTEAGQAYTIDTTAWLAPFDLGVSQTIHFEARQMEEYDIFTLNLFIERLSGDSASWQRVNQSFVNALRKQFLIWRTVDPADKLRYREKGERILAGEVVEDVDV